MTVNELLLWLSARKQGSWPQFRAAIEELDLTTPPGAAGEDTALALHQQIRFNLERLAHVEFNTRECENGWRVVPPILALSENSGKSIGVLCGARTPKLLHELNRVASVLKCERIPQPNCPDVHRILSTKSETLIECAETAGVRCQVDAPTALLSHLPKIDSLGMWHREALPSTGRDWEVREFVVKGRSMRWTPITLREAHRVGAEGLFRFSRFQTPQYFIRQGRDTIRIPGAIGKYYVLSRKRVLSYDRRRKHLSLPAICRPPLLVERSLILCSGLAPSISTIYGRLKLTYQDVPEEIAGLAAEVLCQELL
jgi:hypothetical protein